MEYEDMKIKRNVYEEILSLQRVLPPETGGILGSKDGVIVASCFDAGIQSKKMCSYIPDTDKLNSVIKQWQQKNVLFMGIYHTHFFNVDTLSNGDVEYIEKIFYSMPSVIDHLYFPLVVMPNKKIVCYVAKLVSKKLAIEKDDLEII
jgi:hypothetical protein